MTARVFVPLVGANGEGARLFEAIADSDPPRAHPARLTPQIAELFDFGLYGVGQTVREAVTRFVAVRRAKLWLNRRNGAEASWSLRISDLEVGRLSEENSRSAGLGLAVAALCQAFGRAPGVVFATGEIVLPSAPGDLAVAVGAVGGMRGKLALIGDYILRHRALLAGKRLVLALPATALDGRPLAEAERSILTRLIEAAAEIGAKLEIAYLKSLDDLEGALGPFAIPEFVTPRRAATAAAVLIAIAALFAAGYRAAFAPIALGLEPVSAGPGADADSDADAPRRARYDASVDKVIPLARCFNAQREPLVLGGESLILNVSMRDAYPLIGLWRPPRLFVASVSREDDPVILEADRFKSVAGAGLKSGGAFTELIPIEPKEDEVRLFVVATRDPGIDATRLQSELRAALQGLSGPSKLTTTASFLADRVGNVIDYQFKVTNDPMACPT